jgi:hypothetical protein
MRRGLPRQLRRIHDAALPGARLIQELLEVSAL